MTFEAMKHIFVSSIKETLFLGKKLCRTILNQKKRRRIRWERRFHKESTGRNVKQSHNDKEVSPLCRIPWLFGSYRFPPEWQQFQNWRVWLQFGNSKKKHPCNLPWRFWWHPSIFVCVFAGTEALTLFLHLYSFFVSCTSSCAVPEVEIFPVKNPIIFCMDGQEQDHNSFNVFSLVFFQLRTRSSAAWELRSTSLISTPPSCSSLCSSSWWRSTAILQWTTHWVSI